MAAARFVGIDVGTKRIGVSRSDPTALIASPVGTFYQHNIIEELKQLHQQSKIKKFIIGWPLSLNGHENESTRMVESFINKLRSAFPETEIVTMDERFTSKAAKQVLIDSGIKKKKRAQKGIVDSTAAAILLQEYLDEHN